MKYPIFKSIPEATGYIIRNKVPREHIDEVFARILPDNYEEELLEYTNSLSNVCRLSEKVITHLLEMLYDKLEGIRDKDTETKLKEIDTIRKYWIPEEIAKRKGI